MEGVQSCTNTQPKKYVQSKYGTFEDITCNLKKPERPVDTSSFKTVPWYDRDAWQRGLRPEAMEMRAGSGVGSTSASAAAALKETKAVLAEARSVTGEFYDGRISEDDFKSAYKRLAEGYVNALKKSGYPDRLSCHSIQCQIAAKEVFYDEFRKTVLEEAVSRNNAEGRKYAAGEKGNGHRVKYYNSDYYYKSEAAIDAITKAAYEVGEECAVLCKEHGYDKYSFEVPDYKSGWFNLYYNFNSAWSNNFLAGEQFITDYDAVPPRNFQWFYESGGNSSDGGSDTIWAKWTDEDGTLFSDSCDFRFEDGGKDIFWVSELLKFRIGDSGRTSEAERFLDCLQVFRQGRFAGQCVTGRMNLLV